MFANWLISFLLPPFYPSQSPNCPGVLLYYDKHLKKMTFLPQKFSSSIKWDFPLGGLYGIVMPVPGKTVVIRCQPVPVLNAY